MKLDKILEYAPEHLVKYELIAGMDEVGRGCGAGPLVTAAVILPKEFSSPLLRDSKLLNEKRRNQAYQLIMDNALAISTFMVSEAQVDLGLNPATFECFRETLNNLSIEPDYVLLDGQEWDNRTNHKVVLVVKGDDTYSSIAAAAIVAKVTRDKYMCNLALTENRYDFENNKGYLTPKHIAAIQKFGPTIHHRKTFIKNIKINLDSTN